MKFLLDTNVYIEASSSVEKWNTFQDVIIPLLPFTYLSSVVAFELKLASRSEMNEKILINHIQALEKVGRLMNPNFQDWVMASEYMKNRKFRSDLCDVLIGCSARRIGALLFTFDFKDFTFLAKRIGFKIIRPW